MASIWADLRYALRQFSAVPRSRLDCGGAGGGWHRGQHAYLQPGGYAPADAATGEEPPGAGSAPRASAEPSTADVFQLCVLPDAVGALVDAFRRRRAVRIGPPAGSW